MTHPSGIILGIDPGSNITGYGLIAFKNKKYQYVTSGILKKTGTINERLWLMFQDIHQITKQYQPTQLAIETSFMHKNSATAIKLGQAKGMLIGAIQSAQPSINLHEYAPREIKKNIVGYGNAQKNQMQYMMKMLLNLPHSPSLDEADALACALCYYHHHNLRILKS